MSISWSVPAPELVVYERRGVTITSPSTYNFTLYPNYGNWNLSMNNDLREHVWWLGGRPSEKKIAKKAKELIEDAVTSDKWAKKAVEKDARNAEVKFDYATILREMTK